MNIAIDIREAAGEKTGKGWYVFNIVRALLKIDQKNHYILLTKAKIPGLDQFSNARQLEINSPSLLWHHKAASIIKANADLFFAPTSFITPSLLPKDFPILLTIHDLVAFLFPANHKKKAVLIEKLFLRRALKKASAITTVSDHTKKDLLKLFHCDPASVHSIPNDCSADFHPLKGEQLIALKDFAKKTNLPAKFFLSVGTLEPRKNYEKLIEAMKLLAEKHPDTHLIIVGGEGWGSEKIYQAVKDNYLSKRVHFLGYLSNKSLLNLYNLAVGFVFPSKYEGFGIPPLEAMRCGCPVIASKSSSIPEVVGDGGLYIDPDSAKEIAAQMSKLISDNDLRKEMIRKGLSQSQKFSWEASAQKLLQIMEGLVN
ncbi:glycosyltransferase family 4 protein [Patescibacteria group bacterium]|nr:glycosyltransferase family 4 protein [Patescibacteria group bacterium]